MLAVPSAGALISRALWEELGGYDRELPLFTEDVDLGWRANADGNLVLHVPAAHVGHAQAASSGQRRADVLRLSTRAAQRAHGRRTLLGNTYIWGFMLRGVT